MPDAPPLTTENVPEQTTERFAVWQWFEDDWHECVGQNLAAEDAVKLAHSYTVRPAAQIGVIKKVSIVALDDDSTAFLWEFGKGVVFPTREANRS
jgi:hypothetical protein